MSDIVEKTNQSIFLYDRNKLSVTGIASVDSFDENGISATTIGGENLSVEGTGISVTDVNLEKQQFDAVGNFTGVFYSDIQKTKQGFLSSVFSRR